MFAGGFDNMDCPTYAIIKMLNLPYDAFYENC